jgi:arylsulfatase
LIARWPRVIREGGRLTRAVGHIIDFMPTFAELGDATYPDRFNDHGVLPMEGRSLAPVLRGESGGESRTLFWSVVGAEAVRDGKWKLVRQGPAQHRCSLDIPPGREKWELYDMDADRCELHDLAGERPDKVRELDAKHRDWKDRCRSAGPGE